MAVAARKSAEFLMRKTLDRQAAVTRMKVSFKKNQIVQVIHDYVQESQYGPYNELLNILKDKQISDGNFKVLFEDCLSCIIYFEKDWKVFIDLLCGIQWINRGPDLVKVFTKFIISLLSAHIYHSPNVMTTLVNLFKVEGENWEYHPTEELIQQWSNIHALIAEIVAFMPMATNILMQIVMDNFPYYKAGCYVNRAYIHNLIWMSKYIPSLKEQIMSAIIHRMIEMDVNVLNLNKAQDTIFHMEVEKDETSITLDYCMIEMLKWLEDEKDPVLLILCNVFERIVLPTYGIRFIQFLLLYTISINQQCADRIFTNLWKLTAGLHGLGPGALSTRKTAANHLAGLLARCVRVPNSRLIHYLKTMADWCHGYLTATQETSANDNTKVHGAFHAVCHAIFYLVAFKNHRLFMNKEMDKGTGGKKILPPMDSRAKFRALVVLLAFYAAYAAFLRANMLYPICSITQRNRLEVPFQVQLLFYAQNSVRPWYHLGRAGPIITLGINFVESLNLPRLVTCPLNPLRTCPPQVTQAFASVTRSHQVVYCQAIIEKNLRYSLNNAVQYDEWFPYDPYTLPKSGKIIRPLCVEYKDWLKESDNETQFKSLKRKFDGEEDDFLQTTPSPRQRLASSLSNCISPGFKTSDILML